MLQQPSTQESECYNQNYSSSSIKPEFHNQKYLCVIKSDCDSHKNVTNRGVQVTINMSQAKSIPFPVTINSENANNGEPYIFVMRFPGKCATPHPHLRYITLDDSHNTLEGRLKSRHSAGSLYTVTRFLTEVNLKVIHSTATII